MSRTVTPLFRASPYTFIWTAVGAVVLVGCAAGDARFTVDAPAGFWTGLWHGFISWVTLIIGIFSDQVRVYELHNTGGWYDLGFLLGVGIWGGGSHAYRRNSRKTPTRSEQEWEEIGRKVERKLATRLREWAEAEPDEDWVEINKKVADKVKRNLRAWADE
jgi:hypothetical protein